MLITTASFVSKKKEKIQWLTLEELQKANGSLQKPVLIDIYTHWCGWCKAMDKDTYNNDEVVNYINDHYYAVKFDAESKDSILFNGKKYGYNPVYHINELALYLAGGDIGFPTTVFLPSVSAQPAPLSGYLKPAELEPPLKYFGDGFYKTQTFQDYLKKFSVSW